MPLRDDMIGESIAHYRVTARLGAGGMGEVYRAIDSKLRREVAIKVLPQAVTEDRERLARFEREAHVLASLNHAHIAAIYGLEEADGVRALVMELVEGETLADRLTRGAIPLDEALPIALQIAEALEAAHEKGIVHRDLKPANIKLTPEGKVKLLDFGLAKALDAESAPVTDLSSSPTLTQATMHGVLLGTAGYMSPEQAAGRPVDRRADIWAFGVVLFEMLTGRVTFSGETVSHVLAAVLKDEPAWSELPGDVTPELHRLLRRCLVRAPRHRLQAIGDARILIEECLGDASTPRIAAPPPEAVGGSPARGLRAILPWILTALATVAAGGFAWKLATQSNLRSAAQPLRFELALPPDTELALEHQRDALAISPDGNRLAFLVQDKTERVSQIAFRDLREGETRILPNTSEAFSPIFSPDGEWLAFFANTRLWKVAVAGGSPVAVATALGDNRGATWSTDGYIYAAPDSALPLMRVRESGGEFEAVVALDSERRERTHRWPQALPGGIAVLFTSDTDATTEYYDDARIEAYRPKTGERAVVLENASRARYLPSGYLLFARGGSLYGAPFDLDALETTGPAVVVLQGVSTTVASGAAHFAVSEPGDLLFVRGKLSEGTGEPIWVDRSGAQTPSGIPAGQHQQLALSPDGSRVALTVSDSGPTDLWIADLERGTMTRLTFDGTAQSPVWSPDNGWIAYSGGEGLMRRRADGAGEPEMLWESAQRLFPTSWSPDGSSLVVEIENLATHDDLWIVTPEGKGAPRSIVASPADDTRGAVSPDGRWLAFVSLQGGRPQVFVTSFPDGTGKWQASTAGYEPRWSADGRELFYRTGTGSLMAVSVQVEGGETFLAGPPRRLFGGLRTGSNAHSYSVSPDGSRVLILGLDVDRDVDRLQLVLGWDRDVARLTGTGR